MRICGAIIGEIETKIKTMLTVLTKQMKKEKENTQTKDHTKENVLEESELHVDFVWQEKNKEGKKDQDDSNRINNIHHLIYIWSLLHVVVKE